MNTKTKERKVKSILDNELNVSELSQTSEKIDKAAIKLFQKLFVEELNFDVISGAFSDVGEKVPVENWNKRAKALNAYLIAESGSYRVVFIKLEKLTRTAQRYAVSSLTKKGWARKGEFIAIFHAPDSDIWHLVSPYLTEGRTVLRRYVIGKGENHRTVSENLAKLDATKPSPLFERVEEAFQLKPVTEEFYKDYKDKFALLKEHLTSQGVEIGKAKTYTHLLLNRLMFLYFIQKKGWLDENKDFIHWYFEKYRETGEEDRFHNKWLNKLFFDGMNQPPEEKSISVGFPEEVCRALNSIPFLNGGLFEEHEVDGLEIEISDSIMRQAIDGFLENYNFTITEESPFDRDVAVDPAMLGKIYESLIAEQERGKAGIFYTPRVEVDLMCRLALYEYLTEDRLEELKDNIEDTLIRELIDEENREELIEFLFTPLEEWDFERAEHFKPLKRLLEKAKIVDPACGSGAFLVGMMQVLIELYRKMGIEPDYHLKEMAVNDNLHGVDIKDWAVRMAEFRLWLSLIEGEEKLPAKEPVLPNFSFKLYVGDSIVQKIGDEHISLKAIRGKNYLPQEIQDELSELETLKKRHFSGEKDMLKDIKNKQIDILDQYLDLRIGQLKERKQKSQQLNLNGELSEETKEKVRELEGQITNLREDQAGLHEARKRGLFIWDLDFSEVMLNGGFDIVIANPPYVRQEKIIEQDIDPEKLEEYSSSKRKKLKNQYKADLRSYILNTYNRKVGKRSDLYLYFFFKGIELLNDTGNLVFISSNSWLDVGFGKYLQEMVLKEAELDYLIDNRSKRSFEESDVNTVISVMRKQEKEVLEGNPDFVAFKQPFEEIMNPEVFTKIMANEASGSYGIEIEGEPLEVYTTQEFRELSIGENSLWKIGGGTTKAKQEKLDSDKKESEIQKPEGSYSGSKWGRFTRAPDIYFQILDKCSDKLVPLKEVADVKRGFTTGANDFFYPPKPGQTNKFFRAGFEEETGDLLLYLKNNKVQKRFEEQGFEIEEPMFRIEKEYWMHEKEGNTDELAEIYEIVYEKNGTKWVPNYVVKSPKEIKQIKVNRKDLSLVALMIHNHKNQLDQGVSKYIEWGEKWKPKRGKRYPERPTCKTRNIWYKLPILPAADIFFRQFFDRKFDFPLNRDLPTDHTFYYITNVSSKEKNILGAFLNSSLGNLFTEIYGRVNMGEGVLTTYGPEMRQLPVIDIEEMEKNGNKIKSSFKKLTDRGIINSIFKEIGAENPKEVSLDKVKEDRRELDNIIMADILGLSEKEQLEVYKGVIKLVKERIEKARSV